MNANSDLTKFISVVTKGHVGDIKKLLNKKDLSASNRSLAVLLVMAVKRDYNEIVRLMLEDGRFDPMFDKSYVVRVAASNKNYEILKMLIEDGRVDITTYNNFALRVAIVVGREDIYKLLLDQKEVLNSIFKSNIKIFSLIHETVAKYLNISNEEVFKMYELI